jgi:hypothetical protein
MQIKKLAWLVISSLAMLTLTACNIGATPAPTMDINAVYTQAAETFVADFSVKQTQTALSAPPTATATNTLVPTANLTTPAIGLTLPAVGTTAATLPVVPTLNAGGSTCNNSTYVADVTIPDGTILKPGADFKKTWSIQNSGTCAWTEGYVFAYASGDDMDGYDLPIAKNQSVAPGQIIEMTINMTAHIAEGTYIGYWRMKDPQGNFFGATLYYKIKVQK